MKKEIKFLLESNLMEHSDTEWASPCVLIQKSDNDYRMCTDYRKTNSLTRPDSFPMPRNHDIIDSIESDKFVTKTDLLRGYYQIPPSPSAKCISSFVTSDGLFSYRVMPIYTMECSCYIPAPNEPSDCRTREGAGLPGQSCAIR